MKSSLYGTWERLCKPEENKGYHLNQDITYRAGFIMAVWCIKAQTLNWTRVSQLF